MASQDDFDQYFKPLFALSHLHPVQVAAISWSWHWRPLWHAPIDYRHEGGAHPSHRQVQGQAAFKGHRCPNPFLGLACKRPTAIHSLCEVWRGQGAAGWSRRTRCVPHHTFGEDMVPGQHKEAAHLEDLSHTGAPDASICHDRPLKPGPDIAGSGTWTWRRRSTRRSV